MSKLAPFHTNGQEFWTDERCFITELVNHEDSPDVSLALGRVEVGVTTQLHALGVEEIYTVKDGTGLLEVDGETLSLGAGDSVRITAGQAQRITNTGKGDLVFYLTCRPRFMPQTYKNLEDET